MKKKAIVVGAGIIGLATARTLALIDYQVTIIERSTKALGASIRNFGMIWPVGQPDGELYECAKRSKSVWLEICREAGLWHDPAGSLHLAFEHDEHNVLYELNEVYRHRGYRLLSPKDVEEKSPFVKRDGLLSGLFSAEELIVNPRQALAVIPSYLAEKYKVAFVYGKTVTGISHPFVYTGGETYEADVIYVCSGADFETLYPDLYGRQPLTKCKLQMMRLIAEPGTARIGPAMCGALSLVHYQSFKAAPSLETLKERFETDYPQHLRMGIHVMAAQHEGPEITVGDSHEYGLSPDPFDKQYINELILSYLGHFSNLNSLPIAETWHGVYAKRTDHHSYLSLHPEQGVTIINATGGAGMTFSFGLASTVITK